MQSASFGSHPLATFSSWHSGLAQTSGKPSPATFPPNLPPKRALPSPGMRVPLPPARPGRLAWAPAHPRVKSRVPPRASHCRAAEFAPGPSIETRQVFQVPFCSPSFSLQACTWRLPGAWLGPLPLASSQQAHAGLFLQLAHTQTPLCPGPRPSVRPSVSQRRWTVTRARESDRSRWAAAIKWGGHGAVTLGTRKS